MIKIIAAFLLLSPLALQAEEKRLTFDDLPRLIREKNERVQAAALFLEAAQSRSGALGRSFLPQISGDVGRESFRTGTEDKRSESFGSVGATLNAFRSGRDKLDARIHRAEIQAAEAELEETYRSELEHAREIFWVLAYQREMSQVLTGALEKNAEFLKAANRKINSGLSTNTDALEFEINQRELEEDLTRLEAEAVRAEKMLRMLTIDSGTIETPVTIPHDHDDVLIDTTFNAATHPSVRALDAVATGEQLNARDSNRWWTPSIDLYTTYSLYTFREREYESRSDRDETVAGGKVSMTLFDGLRSTKNAGFSSRRAAAYAKNREQTKREIQADVEASKETLQRLHDLVHSAEENVALGEKYMKNTLIEYNRGVKNSPDLVGAVEKLVELKRRDTEIRRDYQLVKSRLVTNLTKDVLP